MNKLQLKTKKYNIPLSQKKQIKNYRYIISAELGKYIEVIYLCGGICLYEQFIQIVETFDREDDLTIYGYKYRADNIINELLDNNFIKTGFANRYKYIILTHPSVVLIEGSAKTKKRIDRTNLLKTNNFIKCIYKIQAFIDTNEVYEYGEFFRQALMLTKEIYSVIIENNNLYDYDLITINKILNSKSINEAKEIVKLTDEKDTKLGVIRIIWEDIVLGFIKLSKKSLLISENPHYLSINISTTGYVTLHYIPRFVVFDSLKNIDYYKNLNDGLELFISSIPNNHTIGIKNEYKKSKRMGTVDLNRVGYSLSFFTCKSSYLNTKVKILNEPFYNNYTSAPMVDACEVFFLEIDKFVLIAGSDVKNIEHYKETLSKLDSLLKDTK